ncbi:uncharacterized protein G2W53_016183 [Senna tora]|uniref:Uncharacterized protein n=1 Tax=Senna tora TaxID=362788 RepID=A0A835C8X6_9FABA|nr:uncharacterized protein G2W53_016183 [Senna tora]
MHARQRSPGNAYRSGSMGMGMNPPEGSIRGGHGFYANRDGGFGRGHGNPKSFPPPSQPPFRKGDVFMEAGRLAAEYLVSQGLLPPNTLSNKWQNASFKKHSGEFRAQDGDTSQIPLEGRTSALARLGSSISDPASGRRKFGLDDFNQKGRRRGASFRSNGFDWGRDFKRSGSWSDRLRASPEIKDNDDTVTKHHYEEEEQQLVGGVDNGLPIPNSSELVPKSEDSGDLDTETDKGRVSSEMDLKASSSTAANNTYSTDVELIKSSNNLDDMCAGGSEVKDNTCDDDSEKPSISKNLSVPLSADESHTPSRVCTDLLTLCKSVKVPTRTRSSLTYRGSKVDSLRNNGIKNTHDTGCIQKPEIVAEESVNDSSSVDMLGEKTYDLKHLGSEVTKEQSDHAADNVQELDVACNPEQFTSVRSQSCQDGAYLPRNNQESIPRLPEYGSCCSIVEERGEKRVAEADDLKEETKKLKEWLPSFPSRTEDYFLHDKPIGKNSGEDNVSPMDKVTLNSDQVSLLSNPQFMQGGNRSYLQRLEETQSLPNSFRTCDLNLIEASEIHENNDDDDPILIYPSVSETKKGTEPVDIDLSISHASVSGGFSTCATSGKEIEVIDLESDSVQEGRSSDNNERKTEAMFPGHDGFSNHAQNAADMTDVQDGYGLMISELLGSDFTNCSSVSGDINSVHNEMGLHNGTVFCRPGSSHRHRSMRNTSDLFRNFSKET